MSTPENSPNFKRHASLTKGRIYFSISKSFGRLDLIPEATGLRLWYIPVANGELDYDGIGHCEILIPRDGVGGLWATARAFLYGVESLDENIIIRNEASDTDVLVKLYRDKPKGAQGALSGEEVSWLRIVSGRSEEERRRIKLGPRDLLSVELACTAVLTLSASSLYQNDGQRNLPAGSAPAAPAATAQTARVM